MKILTKKQMLVLTIFILLISVGMYLKVSLSVEFYQKNSRVFYVEPLQHASLKTSHEHFHKEATVTESFSNKVFKYLNTLVRPKKIKIKEELVEPFLSRVQTATTPP